FDRLLRRAANPLSQTDAVALTIPPATPIRAALREMTIGGFDLGKISEGSEPSCSFRVLMKIGVVDRDNERRTLSPVCESLLTPRKYYDRPQHEGHDDRGSARMAAPG